MNQKKTACARNLSVVVSGGVFALFLSFVPSGANAATINASSCTNTAVQSAVNQATQPGDVVVIPSCSGGVGWTGQVSWNAPADAELRGSGTAVLGGGNQTVITDNYASGGSLLNIRVSSSGTFKMSGITFQSGSGSTKDGGTLLFNGPGRIKLSNLNLNFNASANYKILDLHDITGVIHNSIIFLRSTNAIYVYRDGTDGMANQIWAQDTGFGTDDFFYVEDNVITGTPATRDSRVTDIFWGGKIVVRFNTITAACGIEYHATGSWGNGRGGRAAELYNNKFSQASGQAEPNRTIADVSSGTTLVWGNDANQIFKQPYIGHIVRANNDTYSQTATPNGWGYCGSGFNGTGSTWDGGTALGTDTTNGYPCLDQPGRGKGDLITGSHPNKRNTFNNQIYWSRQQLEPIYIWDNADTPAPGWGGSTYSMDSARIVANRDYYPRASGIQTSPTNPFNGASGTGWGTLANRPVTCTTGVGYFAVDQGSWNTSTSNLYGVQRNGQDGVLYKCTATNTWTAYYTPYTYPHPLTQTGGTPDTESPTSPTSLSATSPSQSSISVSWTASTDNVGVTGYIIERCQGSGCSTFAQVGTPTASPFVDSGLTANTFYNYHVRARDAAGNLSGWSNVVGATTQAPDTTPPSAPGNLQASVISSSNINRPVAKHQNPAILKR